MITVANHHICFKVHRYENVSIHRIFLVAALVLSGFSCWAASKSHRLRIATFSEIGWYYDCNNRAREDTISRQLLFLERLGVTHVPYFLTPVNRKLYHIHKQSREIRSNETASWIWSDCKRMKDSIEAHHMQMIPSAYNVLSHSSSFVAMLPEASAIPPYHKLFYIRTSFSDHTNPEFRMNIFGGKLQDPAYVFVAYDSQIGKDDQSNVAPWLKDFEKINMGSDIALKVRVNNDIREFDLYRSKNMLTIGSKLVLGRNTAKNTNASRYWMYSVFAAKAKYDAMKHPEQGILPEGISYTVRSQQRFGAYQGWAQYTPRSDSLVRVYSDAMFDNEFVKETGSDISGIISFIAYATYTNMSTDIFNVLKEPVHFNHVSIPNNDRATVIGKARCALFEESLMFIKKAYNNGDVNGPLYPQYIDLGYDELGYGRVAGFCGQKKEEIAADIVCRIKQIDSLFPSSKGTIIVFLWADSFCPSDNGQLYNLCGDGTKNSGVLELLRDTYSITHRIILKPWKYHSVDGDRQVVPTLRFDKITQAHYLNTLVGVSYTPVVGEGVDQISSSVGRENTMRCTYEWFRAGELFSDHLVGYSMTCWDDWDNKRKEQMGYFYPVYAYLSNYPYLARSYLPSHLPNSRMDCIESLLSGVDYTRSRNELGWSDQAHYVKGFSLVELNSNGVSFNANGSWDTALKQYSFVGSSKSFLVNNNGLYAFFPEKGDCEFRVRIKGGQGHREAGILVKESLEPQAAYVYVSHMKDKNQTCVFRKDSLLISSKQKGCAGNNGVYIKIVRVKDSICCSSSADGTSYVALYTCRFKRDEILIGMACADNSIGNTTTTFSDIRFQRVNIE